MPEPELLHDWVCVTQTKAVWKCKNCDSTITQDARPAPNKRVFHAIEMLPVGNMPTSKISSYSCAEVIAKRIHES